MKRKATDSNVKFNPVFGNDFNGKPSFKGGISWEEKRFRF